jgi:hypothetical protein
MTNYHSVRKRTEHSYCNQEVYGLATAHQIEERFMALDTEPYSSSGIAFTTDLSQLIHEQAGKRYKITIEFRQAVGVMIGDLLANAIEGIERYGYRSIGLPAFTGMAVGYKPFKAVMDAMESLNLLEVAKGDRGSLKGRTKERDATRFRAKSSLLEMALGYGVTPDNWSSHFRQMPRLARVAHPILLRSCSTMKRSKTNYFKGYKLPGTPMKVDMTLPGLHQMAEQVHDINRFMARQELGLGDGKHRYFQRIFGQGDTIGESFTKGGRLYSPGKDSYQQMTSDLRANITINGEATVEVDIGSSFLTIYRVLKGVPFDPQADAYADIGSLTRGVAKTWVVVTFGYDRFHTRWPPHSKAKYKKGYDEYGTPEYGTGDLQKDHPIGQTHRLMLTALPELSDWPTSEIRWGDLQYVESCAMSDAVHMLAMQYGVTALPVHDSIRVPVSAQDLATRVLSDAFYKHVGVRPVIKAK